LISIRPARREDEGGIWRVIEPVIREGRTYALDPALSEADAIRYWHAAPNDVYVAESGGEIVGTYFLRPNHAGGGAHVANCGYITAPWAGGRGVARAMCAHSLELARQRGFRAMQFNFVISTNERAIRLWASFGFAIVGRLPGVFNHPDHGFVDALVMHREL
jgi:ribosomal protein S18 acetylase RimI-like enzyme